jgi:hypothetical protein
LAVAELNGAANEMVTAKAESKVIVCFNIKVTSIREEIRHIAGKFSLSGEICDQFTGWGLSAGTGMSGSPGGGACAGETASRVP